MIPLFLALSILSISANAWTINTTHEYGKIFGVHVWQRKLTSGNNSVTVHSVTFQNSTHTIRVTDHPPPHQRYLADAARSAKAIAGCNASYFHPDFRPLGLVIADGRLIHDKERAPLLSGILLVRNNNIQLVRSTEFHHDPSIQAAIQAGPWLVENGKPVSGLENLKRARRTLIATDDQGRWALIATSPITLHTVASLLTSGKAVPNLVVRKALNLDGGSSTALWAATQPELVIPEFTFVRNFVLIFPK